MDDDLISEVGLVDIDDEQMVERTIDELDTIMTASSGSPVPSVSDSDSDCTVNLYPMMHSVTATYMDTMIGKNDLLRNFVFISNLDCGIFDVFGQGCQHWAQGRVEHNGFYMRFFHPSRADASAEVSLTVYNDLDKPSNGLYSDLERVLIEETEFRILYARLFAMRRTINKRNKQLPPGKHNSYLGIVSGKKSLSY